MSNVPEFTESELDLASKILKERYCKAIEITQANLFKSAGPQSRAQGHISTHRIQ